MFRVALASASIQYDIRAKSFQGQEPAHAVLKKIVAYFKPASKH